MAVGSKELAPAELDTLEDERLLDELRRSKEELFNLRFQAATGQLESHGRLRAVKKDIARIYTVMRERELGITDVIKLASNENPLGTSPCAAEAIRRHAEEMFLYPDGGGYYLRRALALAILRRCSVGSP